MIYAVVCNMYGLKKKKKSSQRHLKKDRYTLLISSIKPVACEKISILYNKGKTIKNNLPYLYK